MFRNIYLDYTTYLIVIGVLAIIGIKIFFKVVDAIAKSDMKVKLELRPRKLKENSDGSMFVEEQEIKPVVPVQLENKTDINKKELVTAGGRQRPDVLEHREGFADRTHRIHEYHEKKWSSQPYDIMSPDDKDEEDEKGELTLTPEDMAKFVAFRDILDKK
jgi:hypothetical protein